MHAFTSQTDLRASERRSPVILRIGYWVCFFIAVAVVVRRILTLFNPTKSGPPQMAALDNTFASHAALTLAYILPALLFVLISPFAVFMRFANLRWPERILFPLGLIVGVTACAMSGYSVGGLLEQSAVFVFDTLFLISLFRAWWYLCRGEQALKRRWLLRAVAVLLGIATTRPLMGVFFATSSATHLTPNQFFGIAFWIGFSTNTVVFELWLRSVDGHGQTGSLPSTQIMEHPGRRLS